MSGRASGPIVLELQPLADRVLVERVGVLHHVVACVVGAAIRRLREPFRRANRDVERFLSRPSLGPTIIRASSENSAGPLGRVAGSGSRGNARICRS